MGSGTVFLSARARVLQLGKHVAALMRHNATPMLMLIGACRRCSRIVFAFRQVCVRAWHVSHMVWRERTGAPSVPRFWRLITPCHPVITPDHPPFRCGLYINTVQHTTETQ